MEPLTPSAIGNLYWELLRHPTLANELTEYQKSKLREHACQIENHANTLACGFMEANPSYNYPDAFRNGREFDYWQQTISSYGESQRVLQLLAVKPVMAPQAVLPPTAPAAVEDKPTLRQIAMLRYYLEQPLTDNNAATLAAEGGHKSATSGSQLVKKYAEFCELQQGELPTDRKALTHLEKNLEYVLALLAGEAKRRAEVDLKRVSEKKSKGF